MRQRAAFNAHPAGYAKTGIDLCHIPGGCDHGIVVFQHGFQSTAATGAAVTNNIKAVQAVFLEESIMHMPALVFFPQKLDGFFFCQAFTLPGVVLQHKIGEWLTDDQAHLGRLAMFWACGAATVTGYRVL